MLLILLVSLSLCFDVIDAVLAAADDVVLAADVDVVVLRSQSDLFLQAVVFAASWTC